MDLDKCTALTLYTEACLFVMVLFSFTYSEHPDYGPYLESVNGLAGNFTERTYWQLQVKNPNGTVITPNVSESKIYENYMHNFITTQMV